MKAKSRLNVKRVAELFELIDESVRSRNSPKMTTKLKHLVSKRKRRFVENGFDLDLTCILPQKIMSDKPVELAPCVSEFKRVY